MYTVNKSMRAKIAVAAAVVVMVFANMACDENPCKGLKDQACGLTSPVTDIEQTVIDAVNSTCPTRPDGTCEVFGN